MGVLRSEIYMHVLDDAATKTVLGKHTLHYLDEQGVVAGLDVLVVGLLHEKLGGCNTLSAGDRMGS